jgi:hypothetical protein
VPRARQTTKPSQRRARLLAELETAGRALSTAAVMFHTALSAELGLSASEEKALDLLDRLGPLTAKQLAQHSGLAPASVTGLVDRLERKGFASREPDPTDGRRALIALQWGLARVAEGRLDHADRRDLIRNRRLRWPLALWLHRASLRRDRYSHVGR